MPIVIRAALFILSWLFVATVQPARAEPVDAGHAVAEIISERSTIVPGDRFLAALKLVMDEHWHVYWRNAGDAGIPPSIRWTDPAGATTGEFYWPAPHTIPLEGLMNYGYGEEVVLPFEVVVPADLQPGEALTMSGTGEWQICLDICIWESADLTLILPIGETPVSNEISAASISAALAASPQEIAGAGHVERDGANFRLGVEDQTFAAVLKSASNVRFYPFNHEIEHFPEQPLAVSDKGGVLTLEAGFLAPEGAAPLEGVVVVEQTGGDRPAFHIVAQPGAIPDGLGATPFTPKQAAAPVAPGAGFGQILVWLGFGLLGGLILNLMPCVLPVLSIKANGLMHAAHEGDHSIRTHGLAYFAGVVLCFIAIGAVMLMLRAAGEQAGLGFQLQYPPIVLGLAFLMFLIGLNLLGVYEIGTSLSNTGAGLAQKKGGAGAFFTGLLAAIVGAPCVGPFLAASLGAVVTSQPAWVVMAFMIAMGAGMASPFLALSFFPALARAMPKPGRWMETVKQFLAFPMFLTAVGLMWVFAGQAGADMTMLALAGIVAAMFGIWLLKRFSGAIGKGLGAAALIAGLIAPVVLSAGAAAPAAVSASAAVAVEGEVEHAAWTPEKLAELRAQGRPVFVDFTARWCVTCQFNKKTALQTREVEAAFIENDVVFLTADWTNRDDIIAAELAAHGRAGVPLYLFYPPNSDAPVTLPQLLRPQSVIKEIETAMNAAITG